MLLISARRELLCATAFEAQAHECSDDGDDGQKFQTWVFPNHCLTFERSCTLGTPNPKRPMSRSIRTARRLPPAKKVGGAQGRATLGLALGYEWGWSRGLTDRIFTDRGFADGTFARPFANWCGLDNRLRMRQVRSNRCSHESQRRSAKDNEFQHRAPLATSSEFFPVQLLSLELT